MTAVGEGPDDGHTFEITVQVRGSYGVTGEPHHRDAEDWGWHPISMQVRAWDLHAALRKAAETPLYAWAWPLSATWDDEGEPDDAR